jgi:two-component system, cell cycle sensor histidine kinase and response regulator CckA
MTAKIRALMVEDVEMDAKLIELELRRAKLKLEVRRVEDGPAMRAALMNATWDVILCDWALPKFSALAAIDILKETALDIPLILVSGTIGEDMAADAMRAGAKDYVLKNRLARLAPAIEREVQEARARESQRATEARFRESEARLHESELQLRHAQKMEAVGRLAGGIAHDFNNVLSVILSYCEMVLGELPEKDPLRPDIEEIGKAGKRAAELTRHLLMFSRQRVIAPKVLDLNEVLTNMDKMVGRILGADVELVALFAQSLGRVNVDPSSIEQLVMNLVVNARDAMPTGGRLTIETANVVLDDKYRCNHFSVTPGPYVMLSVTDTGVGMDEQTMSRMFEPFFTTKETGKGTGLGLSTVFGIVQQSGGNVSAESEVGKGTRFRIHLPRVEGALDEAHRTTRPPGGLRGSETILVVEDDDQVRGVALGILRKSGYQVLEARNAGEALLFAEKHPDEIHLLLSDVVMPHMSGPELAKRLDRHRPGMKVLCMSGYTDDSIIRHGVLESQFPFLQKPITPETLTRKVREVLDKEPRHR